MIKKIMFLFLFSAGCASTQNPSAVRSAPPPHHLVLLTDFGVKDGAVSAMKGVAYTAVPGLVVSDLTHEIPPYNIWEAAYRLRQTYSYWPAGTVFVTVVDPGVGSERKPVVVKTKSGFYFVGPDNGHLTLIKNDIESVRVINESTQRREGSEQSYTFHGRDLFALVGARLAGGQVAFESVGAFSDRPLIELPYQEPTFSGGVMAGQIPVLDPNYGNVWTNIPKEKFLGDFPKAKTFQVKIMNGASLVFEGDVPLVNTFAGVAKGRPLLYFNSLMNLSLALNQGSFAQKYRIGSGPGWFIHLRAK